MYLHKNKSSYGDCQLITACNAYYFLTGDSIDQNTDYYEELVDLAGCRHGSALKIKKAWEKLGIKEDKRYKWYEIEDWDNFYEVNVWHKFFGFHSISIIDYSKKCEAIKIANLKHVTSSSGWIFIEDFKSFIIENPDKSKPYWNLRTFKLIR